MELHQLSEALTLVGLHVADFPEGIKPAFDRLVTQFGFHGHYYGISWMDDREQVQYYAMLPLPMATQPGELVLESLVIPSGTYRTETMLNWMSQTHLVKDVFSKLLSGACPDRNNPCIEWYKSDDELVCLVKQ